MISQANIQRWIALGDKRTRDERIQQARTYSQTPRQRRENAIAMDKANSGKTPQERLAELDHRLGKDCEAVKERARLNKLVLAENEQ
jgi:hypothetical protein